MVYIVLNIFYLAIFYCWVRIRKNFDVEPGSEIKHSKSATLTAFFPLFLSVALPMTFAPVLYYIQAKIKNNFFFF